MGAYPQSIPPVISYACGNGQNSRSYGYPLCRETPFSRMMKRHFGLDILHRARCKDILQRLSYETGFSVAQITGDCRVADLFAVRERAYLLMYQSGYGFSHIGRVMNRHHTTVMSSVRKVFAS